MNVKKTYGIFFLVYFTWGVFEAYFGLYIPLYYYEILAVNRNDLAFIQFFGYLSLIITPLVAYVFDAHIESERSHKIFVYIFAILLCSCFSIFLINKNILLLYGIFLGVYFLCRLVIGTIMSKIYLTLSVESPKIKHPMILIINGAKGVSFLVISLFFDAIVKNVYSLPQWELFFMIGWMLTLPLLSVVLFLRNYTIFSNQSSSNRNNDVESKNINKKKSQKKVFWFAFFLYLAFFLASSDLIFLSLISSWVLTRYNEFSLRFFFNFYYVITICSLLGYYFASKIAKRISNISLFFVFCCLYLFFLVLLPLSNFPMFLAIQCGLAFAGYIANYLYVSIAQTISVNARYKTVVYQLLLMSQSIANIVFTPIGTSLSAFISVEKLIFFSSILLAFSCGIQLILVLVNKIKHIKEFK